MLHSKADWIRSKIDCLSPEQLARVEALLTALGEEDHDRSTRLLSESAFAAIWSDPENDVYDSL